MRMSDWSSDVCSSDLRDAGHAGVSARGDCALDQKPGQHAGGHLPLATRLHDASTATRAFFSRSCARICGIWRRWIRTRELALDHATGRRAAIATSQSFTPTNRVNALVWGRFTELLGRHLTQANHGIPSSRFAIPWPVAYSMLIGVRSDKHTSEL